MVATGPRFSPVAPIRNVWQLGGTTAIYVVTVQQGAVVRMPSHVAQSWFERNPKKTLIFVVVLCAALLDMIAGYLLIPTDYNRYRRPHDYYHHTLQANADDVAEWGGVEYSFITNSLGFRDAQNRQVELSSRARRVVLIGDSFIEGKGVTYDKTVAGFMSQALEDSGVEILNAGVDSYSPRLYYLKIKHLLERVKLRFDELIVFIDISDIQNDIVYDFFTPREESRIRQLVYSLSKFFERNSYFFFSVHFYLEERSGSGNLFYGERLNTEGVDPAIVEMTKVREPLAGWTYDQELFELYGYEGLELAKKNMDQLIQLCERYSIPVSIVVYPWPVQIFQRDFTSMQVVAWREFSSERGLPFVNLFPDFINTVPAEDIYRKYFITNDVHWNELGNKLVSDRVVEELFDD